MRVYSIFTSIDGEVSPYHQGAPTVFVRLSGCNLRCSYCDTQYAYGDGEITTALKVFDAIKSRFPGIRKVTITGGEPLLQDNEVKLLCQLLEYSPAPYQITIETNGSILVEPWEYYGAKFIVDFKCPSSGMMDKMKINNFQYLRKSDFVKFVVSDLMDLCRAKLMIDLLKSYGVNPGWAFSPMIKDGDFSGAKKVVSWLLTNPIRGAVLSVQLHKLLGLDEPK